MNLKKALENSFLKNLFKLTLPLNNMDIKKEKIKVLLIGATSKIAVDFIKNYLNNNYDKEYELILGVRNKEKLKAMLPENKLEVRDINLSDIKVLEKSMQGIEIVINLAANPSPEANFEDLLEPNIIGTYNILEAARLGGIKKVIMASSIHAVKGQKPGLVKENDAPKPLTIYGATKSFVEAICNVYANNYDMTCVAIRIGAYVSEREEKKVYENREEYHYVISQRDFSQLLHKAIITNFKETKKVIILHGSSNNKLKRLSIDKTKKLIGYKPKDDFYKIC